MADNLSQYRKAAHYNVTHRRRQNFYALPTAQWQMLAGAPFNILSKFDRVDDAIDSNAEIAARLVESGMRFFGLAIKAEHSSLEAWGYARPLDMDKARSTINQLYRDWSAEGETERQGCYGPVLNDLERAFPDKDKSDIKILIPGAGLGRLVFEICKLGFSAEGNEVSFHQLITSNWILNDLSPGEQFDLYPFASTFSNNLSLEHQLKVVKVPDVHPGDALDKSSSGARKHAFERMSMTAGDFILLYGDEAHKNKFDAVVSVFFIDTAPNVLRYVESVNNCLKEGGLWFNLGPLLWHFEEHGKTDHEDSHTNGEVVDRGIGEPGSVELTEEELLLLLQRFGFGIEKHKVNTDGVGYIQSPHSLFQHLYHTSYWIAKKANRDE